MSALNFLYLPDSCKLACEILIIVIVKALEIAKNLQVKLGITPELRQSFGLGVRNGEVHLLPTHSL